MLRRAGCTTAKKAQRFVEIDACWDQKVLNIGVPVQGGPLTATKLYSDEKSEEHVDDVVLKLSESQACSAGMPNRKES